MRCACSKHLLRWLIPIDPLHWSSRNRGLVRFGVRKKPCAHQNLSWVGMSHHRTVQHWPVSAGPGGSVKQRETSVNLAWTTIKCRERPLYGVNDLYPKIPLFGLILFGVENPKKREPCWINTVRTCKCVCGKCIYKPQNRVRDQILPHSGRLWVLWRGAMVDHDMVRRMLDQAATRAQRHAELESATTVMERLLNVSLSPEMLPWGSACRYLILFRKKHIINTYCILIKVFVGVASEAQLSFENLHYFVVTLITQLFETT